MGTPTRLDQTVSDDGPPEPRPSDARPWLVITYGNDRSRHIQLEQAPVTIGRGPGADVILHDDRVSKVHCAVRVDGQGEVEVTDNGSRNGTYVDGARIERSILRPQSELRLGGTVLRVEYKDPRQVSFEEEMFRAAVTDPLTGIPNRRWFADRAAAEIARAQRHGRPLGALFVDVDRFKSINDTHGHAVGDQVLRHVAGLIWAARRAEDLMCRHGGEEFVLLLSDAEPAKIAVAAERFRTRVAEKAVEVGPQSLPVTVSIGWSLLRPGDTLDSLLARADAAMYAAKKNGRNRVEGDAPPEPAVGSAPS
ncbi:MAG TPA: GGDEF domain-containing protein [Planctomycetota bacterium]|nr:GGDEF domain-containing protein [Planctomycetota bacterium]